MANKPLIKTNPYLKDPAKRRTLFIATVSTSTAIEGVHVDLNVDIKISKKSVKSKEVSESDESVNQCAKILRHRHTNRS